MENLFQQVTPILEQVSQATGLDLTAISSAVSANQQSQQQQPAASAQMPTSVAPEALHAMLPRIREGTTLQNGADSRSTSGSGEQDEPSVKIEDDMSDAFGQLALDEHGHLHWIGKSSTMTLIQRLRDATTAPINRVSPMEEDPTAPGPSVNKLYYPASVFFGKVRALPQPEEVEYPERDLADKLVSRTIPPLARISRGRASLLIWYAVSGRCVFRAIPLPNAGAGQARVHASIYVPDGPQDRRWVHSQPHGIRRVCMRRLRRGVSLRRGSPPDHIR